MTSITMVYGWIGGSEAIMSFCVVLVAKSPWLPVLFSVLSLLVAIAMAQRLSWAEKLASS